MSAFALLDTSVRRESACPVHFIWDGQGVGRPFVRVGFLTAVLAGLLGSLHLVVHHSALLELARGIAAVALLLWLVGQACSRFAVRRRT